MTKNHTETQHIHTDTSRNIPLITRGEQTEKPQLVKNLEGKQIE